MHLHRKGEDTGRVAPRTVDLCTGQLICSTVGEKCLSVFSFTGLTGPGHDLDRLAVAST